MRQLLFVILLTISLLLLTYLAIVWVQPGKPQLVRPRRRFAFEAAPELFRYVEPELYLESNSIKLIRNSPHLITVYWRLTREHGPEKGRNPRQLATEGKINLRLYRSGELLEIEDIPIKQTSGSCRVELSADSSCCASLGMKENDHYTPWLFSNTLMSQPGMQYRNRRV